MMISRSVSIRLHFLILWLEDYKPSWANYLNCQPIWRLVWWGLANSRKVEAFDFPKQALTHIHTHSWSCTCSRQAAQVGQQQLQLVNSKQRRTSYGNWCHAIGTFSQAKSKHTHTHKEREGGREKEREGKLLGKVSAVVSARGQRNLGSGQSVVAT